MSLDLHHTTKAVPDTRTKPILFTARFNSEAALFELAVPTKLKGLDIVTNVILRVCASSIASLEFMKNPTISAAIGEEFESTALCLDFTLKCSPVIIIHNGAVEPVSAARKRSGVVLDAIRDLSKVTALSIYIEAHHAPTKLHDISDAASQGLFKSCTTQHHIATMYGGIGGKFLDPPAETVSSPSHDEAAASPPPPPSIETLSRKRPRRETDSECNNIALIWAELHSIKAAQTRAEAENEKLKQQNKELVKGMDKLQEKYDALDNRLAALDEKNEESADTYDCELTE
ncbi:hypothetical protein FAVG1_08595 [Fusarium avenaceum]|nr:hypothetical protein FAVG1_08595 [Fusarium avenaceum]